MVKRLFRAGALLVAAALVVFAAPAQSHPVAHDSGAYYLQIAYEDGSAVDAVLTCPGGPLHPDGAEACAQLSAVEGDVADIPEVGGICQLMYLPVTVHAHGHWNGVFRLYEAEFGNLCIANDATGGHVFNFA